MLFRSAVDELGLKIRPSIAGASLKPGEARLGLTEPVRFEMEGKSFDAVPFAVLEETPSFLPSDIQGVAGWPLFKDYIVLLELADQKATVGLETVPAEAADWLRLRLRADHDSLCVELPEIAGAPGGLALVDTGDPGGVSLSAEKWQAWKAAHPRQPVTFSANYMPGSGLVATEESWAEKLSLGGLVLHHVVVRQCNVTQASAGGPGYVASLGLAALGRLDLVIDGKAGVAYTHARTEPPAAFPHNRLGAVFVPRDDRSDDLVAHVAAGSPAARAGIRDDDLLLGIDQRDLTHWRTHPELLPLRKYWEQAAGTKVVLTVRRGTKTIKATAKLKNILGP